MSKNSVPFQEDSPLLLQAFADELARETWATISSSGDPSVPPPPWIWDGIWEAVRDTPSDPQAIGRALRTVQGLLDEMESSMSVLSVSPVTADPPPVEGSAPVGAVPDAGEALFPPPPAAPPEPPVEALPPVAPQVPDQPVELAVAPRVAPPRPLGGTRPDLQRARRRGRKGKVKRRRWPFAVLSWVRNVVIIVILFGGWELLGTTIEHSQGQDALRTQFETRVASDGAVRPATSKLALIPASVQAPQPPTGTVVARLQIPEIGVDQYVVQGTKASDLAKGPGHYFGTAMPGQQGNVAIAGHRTTFGAPFDRLDQLRVGDPITLTSAQGVAYTYDVILPPVDVASSDTGMLDDGGDNRLTLVTSDPKFSATKLLAVVATLQLPGVPPRHALVEPVHVVPGSAGWNLEHLPEALSILLVLGLLGVLQSSGLGPRRLRYARWLFLVPVWCAGLYVLFVALSALVPTTL